MSARARSLLPALFALMLPSLARAEASVVVELRRPDGSSADGNVVLTKGAARYSCTTSGGRCQIQGVAGGTYAVTVEQPGRPSPKQKSVVIPPTGQVKLIVNAS